MRNLHLIFVLVVSLLSFASAHAAPADLPESGQTTCTDAAGAVIACNGTGQDGDFKAGVAWPSPRFTAVGTSVTSCFIDSLTGLMWAHQPYSPGSWITAQLTISNDNSQSPCGFSDWRLPNINEMESLLNSEPVANGRVVTPAAFLNAQGFNGVQASNFWSSTSYAGAPAYAWVVDLLDGGVLTSDKRTALYFWAVRAGQ